MPRLLRTVAVATLLVGVGPFVAVACTQDDPVDSAIPADACSDGGAHVRLGGVTDEACRAYEEAETRGLVVVDATKAPTFTAPAAGSVPATPPPRFTWTPGTLARRFDLERLFVSTAWAHGDTTGDASVLHFRDGTGKELLRVFTTNAEYVPDQATWDRLRASGTVVVTLVGVKFTRNAIATGTKPTENLPLRLTVSG